jgi:secretion/DNA translocation related TadE-like protein
MGCHTADRGAATVYAVAATLVLLLTTAVILAGVELARVQHQVAAAADLAALSGAAAVAVGADGCVAAGRIATANGARVTSCEVDGPVVDVVVEVSSPRLWGRSWTLRQRARAGPAS